MLCQYEGRRGRSARMSKKPGGGGGGGVLERGEKTVMEISRGEQSDQLAAWRPDVQNDGEVEKRITSAWREVVTLN